MNKYYQQRKQKEIKQRDQKPKIDECTNIYYRINNVNDKNDNSNYYHQLYCFKETQLVVCKFDTICKDIQREAISFFSI